jgi:hypothetical protein
MQDSGYELPGIPFVGSSVNRGNPLLLAQVVFGQFATGYKVMQDVKAHKAQKGEDLHGQEEQWSGQG